MADRNRNNTEGQQDIVVGHVYKNKTSNEEVIPYHVDFASAQVNFAPVGRSHEEMTRTTDFLSRFVYVGPVSERAEPQKSNDEALKEQEAARKAEADRLARNEDPTRKTGV